MMRLTAKCALISGFVLCSGVAAAVDLFETSVEELQRIKVVVSSVSKRDQNLFEAPSAVYVITPEDIRRSGLTSVPELLRLVPGMDVAQLTSQKWMVSARGFNNVYADKLLVLVDGRTVYSPFTGGVFWEVQDYPLEDIARIEVIRGPGATLWGSNAVNGVVNIISKKAKDTQGNLLSAIGGTYDRGMGLVRHGGKMGNNAFYRVYAKYFKRVGLVDEHGKRERDGWNIGSGGFQAEGKVKNDNWMLQGRKYSGGGKILNNIASLITTPPPLILGGPMAHTESQTTEFFEKSAFSGQHILGTWEHSMGAGSNFDFKAYHDQTWKNERPLYRENRYTWDFEAQHHYTRFSRQDIVWGVGYRASTSTVGLNQYIIAVNPNKRVERTYNFFVQDDIALKPTFHLTVGSKVEKNVFTGVEVQPSARFNWLPGAKHSIWGAASRAVRIPRRTEVDATTFQSTLAKNETFQGVKLTKGPLQITSLPNKDMDSERLWAFELGYRIRPTETVFSDLAAFYNQYRGLYGLQEASRLTEVPPASFFDFFFPPSTKHYEYSYKPANGVRARSYGFEWLVDWQARPNWKLQAGYSYLKIHAKNKNAVDTFFAPFWEASGPSNQFRLHSDWNLPHQTTLGIGLYYVGQLKAVPTLGLSKTPGYARADLKVGWEPVKNLSLQLVGQNLFYSHRLQAHSADTYKEEAAKRAVYLKLQWGA